MAPKKRGTRKRKTEEALEGDNDGDNTEERGDKRRKHRANKKYIGAHVGIQGESCHYMRLSQSD